MFNTTINDNSKNTGFFNNNLKNEVNITTKKGLFKTKVTVSSSKEIKRKKGNEKMINIQMVKILKSLSKAVYVFQVVFHLVKRNHHYSIKRKKELI